MGYRRTKKRDLWEIYRRWQAGQAVSHIAVSEQRDRKAVRHYVEGFEELGLEPSEAAIDEQHFNLVVENLFLARFILWGFDAGLVFILWGE